MWTGIDPRWWLAVALSYGWVWGSFLNQLVDRIAPRSSTARHSAIGSAAGEPAPAVAPAATRPVSLLHPARSVCLACGWRIPWYQNLPIFSYLLLRGRCRACGTPIGLRTLLVELTAPLVCGALVLLWARNGWGAAWLCWALGAISWLLLAVPLLLERRGAQRPLALLAALLTGWGALIVFMQI